MNVELILAEFTYTNLQPTLDSFKLYFPRAKVTLYTDCDTEINDVNVVKVEPHFEGERYGNRCNDFYKVHGLLNSKADVAIAMDSDMRVVSDKVKTLPLFAERFGLCLPANPRHLVGVDQERGADVDKDTDEFEGCGHAVNMSPIAYCPRHDKAAQTLTRYCQEMLERPRRGPLAIWRAIRDTGFAGYLLPVQWCVCKEDVGCGGEIILHEGHREVRDFYKEA